MVVGLLELYFGAWGEINFIFLLALGTIRHHISASVGGYVLSIHKNLLMLHSTSFTLGILHFLELPQILPNFVRLFDGPLGHMLGPFSLECGDSLGNFLSALCVSGVLFTFVKMGIVAGVIIVDDVLVLGLFPI